MPEPPFWRPNDPVVLVQGAGRSYAHGEDGRFTADGSLYCRFTGQTLAGLLVTGTTAGHRADAGLSPLAVPGGPAEIADLATEAFFLDPGNAHAIAAAAAPARHRRTPWSPRSRRWSGTAGRPRSTSRPSPRRPACSAYGPVAVPSKAAVEYWAPPWAPLYLDWSATYYPTSPPAAGWTFPAPSPGTPLAAQTAQWTGTVPAAGVPVQGRTLLTPQASDALATRLEQLLAGGAPELQPYLTDINDAISYLGNASVLSQALSGFGELLLQRDPAVIQQPDLTAWASGSRRPAAPRSRRPPRRPRTRSSRCPRSGPGSCTWTSCGWSTTSASTTTCSVRSSSSRRRAAKSSAPTSGRRRRRHGWPCGRASPSRAGCGCASSTQPTTHWSAGCRPPPARSAAG